MTIAEDGQRASRSAKSMISLVLSVASVFVSPLLAFAQYVAAMLLGMVASEPSNPTYASVAFFCVFAGIAALAFALPVASLILALRARRDIKQSDGALSGAPIAVTAQVIAVIVIVLLLLFEAFVALNFAGICSLDGCSAAA
jgi:hypothetical protein